MYPARLNDAGSIVVVYTLWSLQSETSIHIIVANTYKITLACAFVPLVAGLYWKRANSLGAGLSIVLGLNGWIAMEFIDPEPPCRHSSRAYWRA